MPGLVSRFKGRYTAGNVTEVLPSYTNSSATITFNAPGDRWNVMAYVRNIENKPDYTSTGTLINPRLTCAPWTARVFGIRLSAKW